MKQDNNAKVVNTMDTVIKKQRFNSHLKGRDGRPVESYLVVSAPDSQRVKWEDQQNQLECTPMATLKAEPRTSLGRQWNARCAAEEWLDQWKVWAGNTLRLQSEVGSHTAGYEDNSQRNEAERLDSMRSPSSTSGREITCYGTTKELEKGTGNSTNRGSGKVPYDNHIRKRSKCEIWKSHSLPHNDTPETSPHKGQPSTDYNSEDITSSDYNGNMISPKSEGFRQRLKFKKFRKRAEVNSVRCMDKADNLCTLDRPSKFQLSPSCAESEYTTDSNRRSPVGSDTIRQPVHNTNFNNTENRDNHQSKNYTEGTSTPITHGKYSSGDNLVYSRRTLKKFKRLHRNQRRQEMIN